MQLHDARDIVLSGRDKSLEDTIRDQLSQWRAEGPMPTAVVCGADVYALAFLDAARELGIDIPGQLSVMGGDDTVPCEHVRPRLSSVRQPLETIARAAVRMLLDQIEGREAVPCVQRFAVELVLRESCAAPAQS
jgi:DNA-binding LacI/PurR family transcriptional regulator